MTEQSARPRASARWRHRVSTPPRLDEVSSPHGSATTRLPPAGARAKVCRLRETHRGTRYTTRGAADCRCKPDASASGPSLRGQEESGRGRLRVPQTIVTEAIPGGTRIDVCPPNMTSPLPVVTSASVWLSLYPAADET